MGKELSERCVQEMEDREVMLASREIPTAPFWGYSPGVEECWMDMDGARMRYLRSGPTSPLLAENARNGAPARTGTPQPALILLHGLLGYSFSWRYTIPALAPYATVYAPDLMGAGFSDRPSGLDHSVRGTARRVLKFIEKLGIHTFDLLGTSRGGAVAMMAAEECLAPHSALKLRRLILVAPVNPYSAHGQRLAPFFGSSLGAALFRNVVAKTRFSPYWHRRLYANRDRIPPEALPGYEAPLTKPGLFDHALSIASTWTKDLRELEEKTLPKLASIPTLLIWGDKDPAVYVSSAKPLAKFFPNSKLVIFPNIGHLAYEECPEEFNRVLIEFLTHEKLPA